MKVTFAFLAFLSLGLAQHHQHGFGELIHNEVAALLTADKDLTVQECTTKCDALFDLIDAGDEQHTDDVCKQECDCQINHHHCGPNHEPHHPNQPHPSPTPF